MNKKICLILAMTISVALLAGCSLPQIRTPLTFDFDLTRNSEGWQGGFTDLPVDYEADIYELEFGVAPLPGELGRGKQGLKIQGHNRSDDLFMFIKKQLGASEGLKPNTTYLVEVTVEFATNVPAGLFGIGGAPGEALFVKVGAAGEEPAPVAEGQGGQAYYSLNVDKGAQSEGGRNAVVVGNIAKENSDEDDWSYVLKSLGNQGQAIEVTSDNKGNLWVFVGTDSGFEGLTVLYYTGVQVILTKK